MCLHIALPVVSIAIMLADIFFLKFLNLNLVIVAEIMSLNRVHHYALKYLHFNCSGVI
jgi:hypothetical protein